MKRLRTLSIKNPGALDRRNQASAWGEPFWRNRYTRKRNEFAARQTEAARRRFAAQLQPYVLMPVESVYGVEQQTEPVKVVH